MASIEATLEVEQEIEMQIRRQLRIRDRLEMAQVVKAGSADHVTWTRPPADE